MRAAREQGRRTTGRQGCARALRSIEPLTPEAWRDLSASDGEFLGAGATVAPAVVVADSHCPWPAFSSPGEPVKDSHAAISRYFFASLAAHYSSRFHGVRCCTT